MRVTITYMEGEEVMYDKDIICDDVVFRDGHVCIKNNSGQVIKVYGPDSFIKMSVNQ